MAGPSTKTIMNVHRTSASKVLLSTRAHVDKLDAGLTSIPGAREVIAMIESRKSVTKLILGHNDLGDEGCRELFRYLCSERGRRYRVEEISLNSNDIGDRGLDAIAEYLEDNKSLRELFLQNNSFMGDPEVVNRFASAINSSRLELLSVVTNQQLSDRFLSLFLSALDSPTLRELQISALGLTPASAPTLITFLTSPRSRALETLKCNGNSLGLRTIRALVRAVKRRNFSLTKLEVYSNHLTPVASSSSATDVDDEEHEPIDGLRRKAAWDECESELKKVLLRNDLLRKRVQDEALALLRYARTLLFCSSLHVHPDPISEWTYLSDTLPTQNTLTHDVFPFRALPLEIQHYILSFLAPALSSSQLIRLFKFSASPSTLRPVLPKLTKGAGCIPDPSCLPFGLPKPAQTCSGGRCMGMGGSVRCHRNEERERWLQDVGCLRFELEEGKNSDASVLL